MGLILIREILNSCISSHQNAEKILSSIAANKNHHRKKNILDERKSTYPF